MCNMGMRWNLVFSFGLLLMMIGCDSRYPSGNDPKKVLTQYISESFSVKKPEDRNILLNYMIGSVKTRLSAWSDDQFREAFLDAKREFLKLSFREIKNVSPAEVQITYELVYLDKGQSREGKSYRAKVTNRKLCQMVLSQGKWYIEDVRNIKELLEFDNELSLP